MIGVATKQEGVVYDIGSGITVECNDDNTFKIKGPKEIMNKAIGGRGDENDTEAWITQEHCKNSSIAISSILEIIMKTQTK